MKRYSTPPEQAAIWGVSPETVIGHIKAGRLKAFTTSPPGCKRPRWKISPEAVAEFEELHGPQAAPKPTRKRAKTDRDYVEYV